MTFLRLSCALCAVMQPPLWPFVAPSLTVPSMNLWLGASDNDARHQNFSNPRLGRDREHGDLLVGLDSQPAPVPVRSPARGLRHPRLAAAPHARTGPPAGHHSEWYTTAAALGAKETSVIVNHLMREISRFSREGRYVSRDENQRLADYLEQTPTGRDLIKLRQTWHARIPTEGPRVYRPYWEKDTLTNLHDQFVSFEKAFREMLGKARSNIGAGKEDYDCDDMREAMLQIKFNGNEARYGPYNAYLFVCRTQKMLKNITKMARVIAKEIGKCDNGTETQPLLYLCYGYMITDGLGAYNRLGGLLVHENRLNLKDPLKHGD